MSNINSLTDGTKVLAIAGKTEAKHTNFINVEEKETQSLKLKYYMWLSRLFVFFASVSLLVFLASSLALFRLAPQVEVEPFLIIRQDTSEGIVRSEPIGMDMASKDLLFETFIKQYILIRNTIVNDKREMNSRWLPGGMVNYMSSWPVFEQFERATAAIMEKDGSDLVREVEIISVGRQGGKKSEVWKVDFKTYDLRPDISGGSGGALIMKERYWTASLTARLYRERVFMGRRLINPVGFTVVRYSQSEVEIF